MSAAANARSHAMSATPAQTERTNLFKEDKPRRIDRVISFFGDTSADDDVCGDELLESFNGGGDGWSER